MSLDPGLPPRRKVKHYDNGEPHFLTFSCYRRLPLLSKDRTRQWFVEGRVVGVESSSPQGHRIFFGLKMCEVGFEVVVVPDCDLAFAP